MVRFITAGESHGYGLTAIIDGLPAGLTVDIAQINAELARRQKGYGRSDRMNIECDTVEILSGVRFNTTIGSPITLLIKNKDWENWQTEMSVTEAGTNHKITCPRPGHADLTGVLKYEREDIRDVLERASARETTARVAVGAIARQLLQLCGICIVSHITAIGGVSIPPGKYGFTYISEKIKASELACIHAASEQQIKMLIAKAREEGDTVGGIFEVIATNVVSGIGSYVQWDRRLDTRLAGAVMSIPGIKGVEFGKGFEAARLPGSEAHDEIFYERGKGFCRAKNNAGGIEGGMSNGADIVIRAAMKPIPTLMRPLKSVDIQTHNTVTGNTERSDICAVPAAAVVGEAMTAIVLAAMLLEKFSCDNVKDFITTVDSYKQRINSM